MAKVWTSARPEADRGIDGVDTAATDGGAGRPPSQAMMELAWQIMPGLDTDAKII